jgi:prefoldin subunit 5
MATKQGPKAPPVERVQATYQQLSLAAKSLNNASDELGNAISVLDAALQKLNLGISAWAQLSGNENPDTSEWWSRSIGYTKVGDKWGIALKDVRGNENWPENDSEELWLFNEAPRWMRIEAVGKIPELLETLLKQAEETTKKIKERTKQAYELAAAMSKVPEGAQPAEEKTDARSA